MAYNIIGVLSNQIRLSLHCYCDITTPPLDDKHITNEPLGEDGYANQICEKGTRIVKKVLGVVEIDIKCSR